jgi:hypothetical protein
MTGLGDLLELIHDAALAFEKAHPEICHRMRYETLVLQPEDTVREIQRFLWVVEDVAVLRAAFERQPTPGPGDYKVEFTDGVHAASIGHGKAVPVTLLPPPMLTAVNEQLTALGHDTLDRGWNAAERSVDLGGSGIWATRLRDLMAQLQLAACDTGPLTRFAVVAEDHHRLRWVIDMMASSVTQGDGDVEAVLTGTAQDLVVMITGEANPVLLSVLDESDTSQPKRTALLAVPALMKCDTWPRVLRRASESESEVLQHAGRGPSPAATEANGQPKLRA